VRPGWLLIPREGIASDSSEEYITSIFLSNLPLNAFLKWIAGKSNSVLSEIKEFIEKRIRGI
jgi:hypothetical protein